MAQREVESSKRDVDEQEQAARVSQMEYGLAIAWRVAAIKARQVVFDYWPGYPPDWEERRQAVRDEAAGRCSRCEQIATQVHHMTPISIGGSHQSDNLEALCRECHEEEHGRPPGWFRGEWEFDTQDILHFRSPKVHLLLEAMREGARLQMKYRKRDGVRSERQVRPLKLWQERGRVYFRGFCELRGKERTFRISRIERLELED